MIDIRKLLVLIFTSCLLTGLVNSQEILSNKCDDFSTIEVKRNLIFSDYVIGNKDNKDFDIPTCSSIYTGISSYFGFTVPSTGHMEIDIEVEYEGLFGIAAYLIEDGRYVEIECNIYRGGKGRLSIKGHSGKEVLGRIWLIDGSHKASLKLALTERPTLRRSGNIADRNSVSDQDFDMILHSDRLLQLTTDEKLEMLEMCHKQFANLPYEKEVIFKEIFPKLQSERVNVAPNFPVRASNHEETQHNIRYWIENHPEEFEHYLHFVNQMYNQYQN
jgi:hypothetical protein